MGPGASQGRSVLDDRGKVISVKFEDTDIYPVIVPEFCGGRPVIDVLEAALRGGAKVVQLRDKNDPERFAADFRKMTECCGALFIMNDDLDLALKYRADGVHLGKEDMPVAEARSNAPGLIIGASIDDLKEALAAERDGATYINIGPIFPTSTKPDLKRFSGIAAIKEISPRINIPFTVIGGINMGNISKVINAGARHIAMVTAITEADDVEGAVRDFIKMMC